MVLYFVHVCVSALCVCVVFPFRLFFFFSLVLFNVIACEYVLLC